MKTVINQDTLLGVFIYCRGRFCVVNLASRLKKKKSSLSPPDFPPRMTYIAYRVSGRSPLYELRYPGCRVKVGKYCSYMDARDVSSRGRAGQGSAGLSRVVLLQLDFSFFVLLVDPFFE